MMIVLLSAYIVTIFLILFVNCFNVHDWDPKSIEYPKARREDVKFSYKSDKAPNGIIIVPDPYNHFENSLSEESIEFQKSQQIFIQDQYLQKCPIDSYKRFIKRFFNYSRFEVPGISGPKDDPVYMFGISNEDQNRPIWFIASSSEVEIAIKNNFKQMPGKEYFDENLLSSDGSNKVYVFFVSPDGKKVLYVYNEAGGENTMAYVRNISSPFIELKKGHNPLRGGDDRFPDEVFVNVYSYVVWNFESTGFIYGTLGDDKKPSQVLFHKLETEQKDDIALLTMDKDQTSFSWYIEISIDNQWLMATATNSSGDQGLYLVASLNQTMSNQMKWITISSSFDYFFSYLTNIGNDLYLTTDQENAKNMKVIKCTLDLSKAKKFTSIKQVQGGSNCDEIIPENPNSSISFSNMISETKLLIAYSGYDKDNIFLFDLKTGKMIQQVLAKELFTIISFNIPTLNNEVWLKSSTFNKPNNLYRVQWINDELRITLAAEAKLNGIDLDSYEIQLYNATSKDGTQVPFYSFNKRGIKLDGNSPLLLTFYGVYGITFYPEYNEEYISWITEHDGFLILANPRGGDEVNGEQWHQDGQLSKRQNSFDDIFAVAKKVIEMKMTSPGKIIAQGHSAAGTSAMVLANQDKDNLFSSIIAKSGLYDMLRFNKYLNGDLQMDEFGNPENPFDFDFLFAYSPLHNVNSSKVYPLILLMTNSNDQIVSGIHTAKMIAELQYSLIDNPNPLLWYSLENSGHRDNGKASDLEQFAIEQCVIDLHLGMVNSDRQ